MGPTLTTAAPTEHCLILPALTLSRSLPWSAATTMLRLDEAVAARSSWQPDPERTSSMAAPTNSIVTTSITRILLIIERLSLSGNPHRRIKLRLSATTTLASLSADHCSCPSSTILQKIRRSSSGRRNGEKPVLPDREQRQSQRLRSWAEFSVPRFQLPRRDA